MLQVIRDKTQTWVAWVIVVLLTIAFGLWGINYYLHENQGQKVVAKVNSKEITQAELGVAYQRLQRQHQAMTGSASLTTQQAKDLKQQALEQLIFTSLLTQAANKIGFSVSPQQIDLAIAKMPLFQENGHFSEQRFQEILNTLLYSDSEFLTEVRSQLLINQAQRGIADTAFALMNEVQNTLRLINQKRDIAYLSIPYQRFYQHINVSDKQVKAFYDAHQQQFMLPEKVSLEYVELSIANIAKALKIKPQQLQEYYQNNIDNYRKPARWQLQQITVPVSVAGAKGEAEAQKQLADIEAKLKKGEAFAKLAGKHGQPQWLSQAAMPQQLSKALANHTKVGSVTAPVKFSGGYGIFKVLAHQPEQVPSYKQVEKQVRAALTQQKAQQIFADQSDQLANLAYSDPKTLTNVAKKLHLTIHSTPAFDRQGAAKGLGQQAKVVQAAFSDDVLKDGNNSDNIQLAPDHIVVLRLRQHQVAKAKPLSEVRAKIKTELRAGIAKKRAERLAQELVSEIKNGKLSGAKAASREHLTWHVNHAVSAHDNHVAANILSVAFAAANPVNHGNKPTVLSKDLSDGYLVMEVSKVHAGSNSKKGSAQFKVFQEEVENAYGQLDYELYLLNVMQQAKIKPEKVAKALKSSLDDLGVA